MGIRFRRSISLAPGLRLNFSGSGVSMSAGPRGASMTFGSRGTYFNTGIAGTGLYSRTRLDSSSSSASTSADPKYVMVKLQITLEDDGSVNFVYDGKPAPDYLVNKANASTVIRSARW